MCEFGKSNGRNAAPNDYYVSKGNDISDRQWKIRKCEVANRLDVSQQTGHDVESFDQ